MCTGWRVCLRLLLADTALVLLLSFGTVSAQTRFGGPSETALAVGDQPLSEALMELAAETGIDLLYDPRLVANQFVSVEQQPGEIGDRLTSLLSGTDLTFSRLSSGTFVLVRRDARATDDGTIFGRIVDAETGRRISAAHVILSGTGDGTTTNAEGLFSFSGVGAGVHRLITTHVGYRVRIDTVRVLPGGRSRRDVRLAAMEMRIAPIVIEDVSGIESVHAQDRLWATRRMEGAPTGIAPDVVRSLNNMMGVRVGDAMADVHVQGGEAGAHQFRLDGVPVFEPVHLRGLIGAFNPFAIGKVTVHKAGFGAEYGSHLSGVIAAEHVLTAPEGHQFDVQFDPLSLNARFQGASEFGSSLKARFMAAARTSLWSLYPEQLYPPLKNLLREWNTPDFFLPQAWFFAFEQQVDPEIAEWFDAAMDSLDYSYTAASDPQLGFGDLHFAGDLRIGSKQVLFGSMYWGWNRLNGNRLSLPLSSPDLNPLPGSDGAEPFRDQDEGQDAASAHRDDYRWLNATAQLQYRALLSPRSLFRTRVRSSEYSLTHAYNALEQGSVQVLPLPGDSWKAVRVVDDVRPTDNGNGIHELALETDFDHEWSPSLSFSVGAEAIRTRYRFAIEDVSDYRPLSDSSSTWRFAWFTQGNIRLTDRLQLTTGSRFTALPHRNALYVEPRGEIQYAAPYSRIGPWSVWTAAGIYRQFVNQFSVSSVSPSVLLPAIRFWLPTDETVAPPKAYHFAGGLKVGPLQAWSLRGEVYYKHQPHLLFIDYISLWDQRREGEGEDLAGQERFLDTGRGYGYGGAVGLEREALRTRLLVRYEFSLARRSRTLLAPVTEDLPDRLDAPQRPGMEPVPWNEPHRIEAAFDWYASDRLTFTGRWRSYWGRAWAFRQSYYDYLATDPLLSPTYGSSGYDLRRPAEHRLAPFYQLDVAAAYSTPIGPTICQIRLDLLNALNRQNEADWTLQPADDVDGENEYRVVARRMLPRTPSITIRLRW